MNFFQPSKAKETKIEEEVVAQFDYEAQESNEISFKENDVIKVLQRFPDNEDWAIGKFFLIIIGYFRIIERVFGYL